MKTLIVTLEIDVEALTETELEDCGFGRDEEGDADQWPALSDYVAADIAELLPFVMSGDDFNVSVFEGSDVYAKITDVRGVTAAFK